MAIMGLKIPPAFFQVRNFLKIKFGILILCPFSPLSKKGALPLGLFGAGEPASFSDASGSFLCSHSYTIILPYMVSFVK